MVTRPEVAERRAELICQQFDSISTCFYPKGDIDRGIRIRLAEAASDAEASISIAIGIVASTSRKFQSYVDVLTTARDYRYLAKQKTGSFWVSDRGTTERPLSLTISKA